MGKKKNRNSISNPKKETINDDLKEIFGDLTSELVDTKQVNKMEPLDNKDISFFNSGGNEEDTIFFEQAVNTALPFSPEEKVNEEAKDDDVVHNQVDNSESNKVDDNQKEALNLEFSEKETDLEDISKVGENLDALTLVPQEEAEGAELDNRKPLNINENQDSTNIFDNLNKANEVELDLEEKIDNLKVILDNLEEEKENEEVPFFDEYNGLNNNPEATKSDLNLTGVNSDNIGLAEESEAQVEGNSVMQTQLKNELEKFLGPEIITSETEQKETVTQLDGNDKVDSELEKNIEELIESENDGSIEVNPKEDTTAFKNDGFDFFNNTTTNEDDGFDFFNQNTTNELDPSANFFDTITQPSAQPLVQPLVQNEFKTTDILATNQTNDFIQDSSTNFLQETFNDKTSDGNFFDTTQPQTIQQNNHDSTNVNSNDNYYDYSQTNQADVNNNLEQYNEGNYQYNNENINEYHNYYDQTNQAGYQNQDGSNQYDHNSYDQAYYNSSYPPQGEQQVDPNLDQQAYYQNTEYTKQEYDPNYYVNNAYQTTEGQDNSMYPNQNDQQYYDQGYQYNPNTYINEYGNEGYNPDYNYYYENYDQITESYNQTVEGYNQYYPEYNSGEQQIPQTEEYNMDYSGNENNVTDYNQYPNQSENVNSVTVDNSTYNYNDTLQQPPTNKYSTVFESQALNYNEYQYDQTIPTETQDIIPIIPSINTETTEFQAEASPTVFNINTQKLQSEFNYYNQDVYIDQTETTTIESETTLPNYYLNNKTNAINEVDLNENKVNELNEHNYTNIQPSMSELQSSREITNNYSSEKDSFMYQKGNDISYNQYNAQSNEIDNTHNDLDDLILENIGANKNTTFTHQNAYNEFNININEVALNPENIPLPSTPHDEDSLSPSLLINNQDLNLEGNDERHGRKAHALFSFGFGGKVISMFPKVVETFNSNLNDKMINLCPTNITISKLKDINGIPILEKNGDNYKPLIDNSAKTVNWEIENVKKLVDLKVNQLESELLHFNEGIEKQNQLGIIILWKLINVLLLNSGKIDGINEQIRDMLCLYITKKNNNNNNDELNENGTTETIKYITPQIKQLLLQGKRKEAAELAMGHRNWGHALIIASCAGKDTWQEVVQSFVKSEILISNSNENDSMAMLYSLFSGLGKSAVKDNNRILEDHQTSPWIEKLVMIFSNRTPGDAIALCTLGDELRQKDLLAAAHFCYLLAPTMAVQGGFDTVGLRMMMLGAIVHPNQFMNTNAFLLTEIYEFALRLNSANTTRLDSLNFFQAFKLYRAITLLDYGETEAALEYCNYILELPTQSQAPVQYLHPILLTQTATIKDRIQNYLGQKSFDSKWIPKKPTLNSFMSVVEGKINQLVMGDEMTEEDNQVKSKFEIQAGPTVFRNGPLFNPQANPFSMQPNLVRRSNSNEVLPDFYRNQLMNEDLSGRRSASPNLMKSPFDYSMNNSSTLNSNENTVNNDGLFSPFDNKLYNPVTLSENTYQPATASPLKTQINETYDKEENELGLGNSKMVKKSGMISNDINMNANTNTTSNVDKEEDKSKTKASNHGHSKSLLGGFFSFFSGGNTTQSKDGKTIYKAKLGEENSFYYDEVQKRWVNKAAGDSASTPSLPPPPPPKNTPKTQSENSGSFNPSPFGSEVNSQTSTPYASGPPSGASTPPIGMGKSNPRSKRNVGKGKGRYVDIFNQ